jgi:glycosyltransferase involved in cell wall biosynthesis
MNVPRVAVVCDLLEEEWPSMDLVADMLLASAGDYRECAVLERIRPPMHLRLTHLEGPRERAASQSRNGGGRRWFNVDRILNRFWDYPRVLRGVRAGYDVFHVVDHAYAQLVHHLPARRTVVTCHDLHTFDCLLDPERHPRSAPFRLMTQRVLSGLTSAARVVFDTSAVRDEVLARGLIPAERTTVVPLGVQPGLSDRPDPAADARAERLLGPADGRWTDLIHVGGTFWRKRVDLALRIFAAARERRPDLRLIRIGGALTEEQRQLAIDLGVHDLVVTLDFIDRPLLAAVYRRSALLLMPSEVEGFGLPVIEAMACGTPVIASDLPVLREVGGAVTAYRPVADVAAWRDAVLELLAERERSPEKWAVRRAAGLKQAEQFTWSEYARKMVEVYQQVARS